MAQTELGKAWTDWITDMGEWHVFGALTYDWKRYPNYKRDSVSRCVPDDIARAHVRRWLREGNRLVGKRLEAGVIALEYQKNGWPHFHPLLRLAGGLQGNEFRELGQLWYREHGVAKLETPRDQAAVAGYATKYLTKQLDHGDVVFWPLAGPMTRHQLPLEA